MRFALAGVLLAGATLLAQSAPPQTPPPPPPQPSGSQQKPPVFRGGATYVSVDAYPEIEGRILEGLTKDDLEVFEDGKRQTIEAFQFIRADAPIPDDDRNTHISAREGLDLAAKSDYRVIVIVLERGVFDRTAWQVTRDALLEYLRKDAEPRDLLGLITTDDTWENLVLGRRLSSIEAELSDPEWLRPRPPEMSAALMACGLDGMRSRIRADATYGMLEGVVRLLGQVREDRANILFVSTGLSRAGRTEIKQSQPMLPKATGLVNGRIQTLQAANDMNQRFCKSEAQRLADTDFSRRFDELTRHARAANVAFYPVPVTFFQPIMAPIGFGASGAFANGRGPMTMPGRRTMLSPSDSLLPLAKETGGVFTSKPGDVTEGLRRIAADNGSHYLLGYSSTNAKRDGKMRSITVRLKKSGDEIRARRQYRAPSMDDLQDMLRPTGPTRRVVPEAIVTALEPLKGVQPSTQFFAYAAVTGSTLQVTIEVPALAVQAGRWADGAALDLIADAADGKTVGMGRGRLPGNGRTTVTLPLEGSTPPSVLMVRLRAEGESITQRVAIVPNPSSLVRDPQVFRSSNRGLNTPVASFMFARDERVKVDWPVTRRLESYEARLLDRFGLPLRFRVPLQEQEVGQGTHLVTELALSPLGRGDYIIELTATAGPTTETRLLALRVR